MQPFSSKMIIADKNHFVYSLFVKNVPYLSIGNKNVFGGKSAISKKQGIATVLMQSLWERNRCMHGTIHDLERRLSSGLLVPEAVHPDLSGMGDVACTPAGL